MTFQQQMLADAAMVAGLTDAKAIQILQDERLISDHCTKFDDIANTDCLRATEYLETLI